MWRFFLWLSSHLTYEDATNLQQVGMTLLATTKSDLKECIHCLLYNVGAIRLTPADLRHGTVNLKAIRSQCFYICIKLWSKSRNMHQLVHLQHYQHRRSRDGLEPYARKGKRSISRNGLLGQGKILHACFV